MCAVLASFVVCICTPPSLYRTTVGNFLDSGCWKHWRNNGKMHGRCEKVWMLVHFYGFVCCYVCFALSCLYLCHAIKIIDAETMWMNPEYSSKVHTHNHSQ